VSVKPGAWKSIEKAIRKHYKGRKIDTTDGIKVQGDGWWVLVRPSNTEPIVRVSAEAESRRKATEMAKEAEGVFVG
jgi:phosphomannomutase